MNLMLLLIAFRKIKKKNTHELMSKHGLKIRLIVEPCQSLNFKKKKILLESEV